MCFVIKTFLSQCSAFIVLTNTVYPFHSFLTSTACFPLGFYNSFNHKTVLVKKTWRDSVLCNLVQLLQVQVLNTYVSELLTAQTGNFVSIGPRLIFSRSDLLI